MPASPADTVSAAYERGYQEGQDIIPRNVFVADEIGAPYAATGMRLVEIREATREWMGARYEHAHTSYYGTEHVRQMCAYWLGRLRAARERA